MADYSCDVLEKKSSCQESEEANTCLEQSDSDTVHSVPQEDFLHEILDINNESLEKFEKGINENQEFDESNNVSVLQECSVLHTVDGNANAESLARFQEVMTENQEVGESKNVSVLQECSVLHTTDGNAESMAKFEKVMNENQEFNESNNVSAHQERSVHHPVDKNAESMAKFEKVMNENQEPDESSNVFVHQECSVHRPVDENTESMAKFEKVMNENREVGESKNIWIPRPVVRNAESVGKFGKDNNRNQELGESKNILGNHIRQCGLKIDVIDDTAVIESGIGGVRELGFVGFACYPVKSSWKQNYKQERYGNNENLWPKWQKVPRNGSRTGVNGKSLTCLFENQNVYKKVYQRRSTFLDEPTKERKNEVCFDSRKCPRSNGDGKSLTRNFDGQNVYHENYPVPVKYMEGRSSSYVEDKLNKTKKVCYVWRKCSMTNCDEKSLTSKSEDQNLYEESGKGSERVHKSEYSRADSNENISVQGSKRAHTSESSVLKKKVYTREEMEVVRYVGLDEQKKTWAEVYYCGLSPIVKREYNGLVATSWRNHIHVNYTPKHSVLVKEKTEEPNNIVAVN